MKTLAIETSCDDTSLAVVEHTGNSFRVVQMLSYSQVKTHQIYGGVVPEIASREHAQQILHVLFHLIAEDTKTDKTFLIDTAGEADALLLGLDTLVVEHFFSAIDSISVTVSPGLPGSLTIGRSLAHFLGQRFGKPVVPVNHIHGHLFSLFIDRDIHAIDFPLMVLTVSGGHNELYLIDQKQVSEHDLGRAHVGPYSIHKIGQSLDDAAGEAFDKVSRMLGGPYPGGPWISKQAEKGRPREDIQVTRVYLKASEYNFSFSGTKSQVYRILQEFEKAGKKLSEQDICDIAYEFQESVAEVLAKKLVKSALAYKARSLAVVGGVSANTTVKKYIEAYLQSRAGKSLKDKNGTLHKVQLPVFLGTPSHLAYCTDNAAMIGVVGLLQG